MSTIPGDGAQIPEPAAASQVEIDGLMIRYVAGGASAGTPLVLFSPWPESIYAYAPMWPRLSSRFSLTAIDLPGFGRSDGRPDLYSPRALGDFLPRIVEALDVGSAHAVGPDVGTAALLFTEALHPGVFVSIQVGGGGAAFPLRVTGLLKDFIDAPSVDAFAGADPAEIVSGAVRSILLVSKRPLAEVRTLAADSSSRSGPRGTTRSTVNSDWSSRPRGVASTASKTSSRF